MSKVKTSGINIGLSEKDRGNIADGLSRMLADTYTLYLKTHNFHWNVTGPMFQTLHLMFMTQYTETWNAVDMLAERIRALGYPAPGSYQQFAALTRIKDSDGVPNAKEMIRQLVDGQEAVCAPRAKYCQSPRKRAISRLSICSRRGCKCTNKMRGCCAACWKE